MSKCKWNTTKLYLQIQNIIKEIKKQLAEQLIFDDPKQTILETTDFTEVIFRDKMSKCKWNTTKLYLQIQNIIKEIKKQLAEQLIFDDPKQTILETTDFTEVIFRDKDFVVKLSESKDEMKRAAVGEYVNTHLEKLREKILEEKKGRFDIYRDLQKENQSSSPSPSSASSDSEDEKSQRTLTEISDAPSTVVTSPIMIKPGPCHDQFEDSIEEDDPYIRTAQHQADEGLFYQKFPNLPRIKCSRHLFVWTLRPIYINSLYNTNSEAFPASWDTLKLDDPIQAWHSFNQTYIKYANDKWKNQGLHIEATETAVDFYNVQALKSEIVKTIKDNLPIASPNQGDPALSTTNLAGIITKNTQRVEELYRCLISELTKIKGRDICPPPSTSREQPKINDPSYAIRMTCPMMTVGFFEKPLE